MEGKVAAISAVPLNVELQGCDMSICSVVHFCGPLCDVDGLEVELCCRLCTCGGGACFISCWGWRGAPSGRTALAGLCPELRVASTGRTPLDGFAACLCEICCAFWVVSSGRTPLAGFTACLWNSRKAWFCSNSRISKVVDGSGVSQEWELTCKPSRWGGWM